MVAKSEVTPWSQEVEDRGWGLPRGGELVIQRADTDAEGYFVVGLVFAVGEHQDSFLLAGEMGQGALEVDDADKASVSRVWRSRQLWRR
jgi:hypothetical protein